MKCRVCQRRRAVTEVTDQEYGTLNVCKKCQRDFYPTCAEEREDERVEERRAERSAEFASAGDYW